MKNIVVATKKNVGYYKILEESCKKHNIDLITLGLGKKWEGFHMKFKLWNKYLSKLDDDEIIMLNDAYDVIILQNSDIILKRFKKYKKKILFCSQKGYLSRLAFNKFNNYVIASGSIIGEVKYIKKLIKLIYKYKKIWKRLKNDDQIILGYVMIKECKFFKKFVGVDHNRDFFFATDADDIINPSSLLNNTIKDLYMKNGKLYNNRNVKPVLLHLGGNVNGNKYLNYLDYNTKKIKIKIHGFYKCKQVLNIMYLVLTRNISVILIIIFIIYKIKSNYYKTNYLK